MRLPEETVSVLKILGPLACHLERFEILPTVGSTNDYLRDLRSTITLGSYAVLAKHQSKGRGRLHRRWSSLPGDNLHLSLLWSFPKGLHSLSELYLQVAQAAIQALSRGGISELSLKHPNDLIHTGKKLGGILIETFGTDAGPCQAIIGIGINVHSNGPPQLPIDQPWIAIDRINARAAHTCHLTGLLLKTLLQMLINS